MEGQILINGHKMKSVNINILFVHKISFHLVYNMSGHQFDTENIKMVSYLMDYNPCRAGINGIVIC